MSFFDRKTTIIKALENYKKQELTAMEMAQLLLSANAK